MLRSCRSRYYHKFVVGHDFSARKSMAAEVAEDMAVQCGLDQQPELL